MPTHTWNGRLDRLTLLSGSPVVDPGEAGLFARNENQAIPTVSNDIQGEIDPLQSHIDFEEHYAVLLNLVRKYSSMPALPREASGLAPEAVHDVLVG